MTDVLPPANLDLIPTVITKAAQGGHLEIVRTNLQQAASLGIAIDMATVRPAIKMAIAINDLPMIRDMIAAYPSGKSEMIDTVLDLSLKLNCPEILIYALQTATPIAISELIRIRVQNRDLKAIDRLLAASANPRMFEILFTYALGTAEVMIFLLNYIDRHQLQMEPCIEKVIIPAVQDGKWSVVKRFRRLASGHKIDVVTIFQTAAMEARTMEELSFYIEWLEPNDILNVAEMAIRDQRDLVTRYFVDSELTSSLYPAWALFDRMFATATEEGDLNLLKYILSRIDFDTYFTSIREFIFNSISTGFATINVKMDPAISNYLVCLLSGEDAPALLELALRANYTTTVHNLILRYPTAVPTAIRSILEEENSICFGQNTPNRCASSSTCLGWNSQFEDRWDVLERLAIMMFILSRRQATSINHQDLKITRSRMIQWARRILPNDPDLISLISHHYRKPSIWCWHQSSPRRIRSRVHSELAGRRQKLVFEIPE